MAGKKPAGLESAKYTKLIKLPVAHPFLCIIGLDTQDGPEHPDYDPRINLPLDQELLASIREKGVEQVVHVCVVDGRPVVIDGRRRVRHAREVDPTLEVTCKVWHLNDQERARFAVRANAHRLQDDPVTEAQKVLRLVDMGVTDEEICADFGWGVGTLRNRKRLVDGLLPARILGMVQGGALSVSTAMELRKQLKAEAMSPEQAEVEAKALADSGTSKQAARARSLQLAKDSAVDKVDRSVAKGGEEKLAGGSIDETLSVRPRPSLNVLRGIVENAPDDLDPLVIKTLTWVVGGMDPSGIKGLTKAVREAASKGKPAKSEKKSGKKAPPRLPPRKKDSK